MEGEPRQRLGIVYGLLLLFLPPLGIYLIWRDRKFSGIARWLLSLFFGLAFAGALLLAACRGVQGARAKAAASGTARAGANGQSEAADEETDFVYEAETGEVRTDRYIYQGRVRDGKPYGEGTFFLADGERITGPVDDDTVSGQAVCEYADGARYIGMVTRMCRTARAFTGRLGRTRWRACGATAFPRAESGFPTAAAIPTKARFRTERRADRGG